jgi:hypothetical protein
MQQGHPSIEKLQAILLDLTRLRLIAAALDDDGLSRWLEQAILETEQQLTRAKMSIVH